MGKVEGVAMSKDDMTMVAAFTAFGVVIVAALDVVFVPDGWTKAGIMVGVDVVAIVACVMMFVGKGRKDE